MNRLWRWFPLCFTAVMLLCVVFLIWYIPAVSGMRFQLDDIEKSIETSRGRERKQQHEYDQVVAEIPEVQSELDLLSPQVKAAEAEMDSLKAERNKLRKEKRELLEQLDSLNPSGEDQNNE